MGIFNIKNLSFQYPDMKSSALKNISLQINEGEFTVICGPSGCGKTTLLSLLKSELAPVGTIEGEIIFRGKPLQKWDERSLIEQIGLVFQDPDNQIVMDEVMQEIVFGLENLGYSQFEMRKRVAEFVHFFGVGHLLHEKSSELSGGQKQMINLLSVLLLKPTVLLLDEPTSQLDPVAANELLLMLKRLNDEMGITIILVEHRLEQLFALADHVIMMDDGYVKYKGTSREVTQQINSYENTRFLPYVPSIVRLFLQKDPIKDINQIPLTVKESRAWITSLHASISKLPEEKCVNRLGEPILEMKNTFFQYQQHAPLILNDFSLTVLQGDYMAIVGGNGSGKTTALKVALGMENKQRGTIHLFGRKLGKRFDEKAYEGIAYLPQNPQTYFMHDTIEEEMKSIIETYDISNGEEQMNHMLHIFNIIHLKDRHPYDCSGGEMQKAALACMLLTNPKLLVIDEPTKGLDPVSKNEFAKIIEQLHKEGLTIIMVTHDIEFAAKHASRCAMLFEGEVTAEGTPSELFKGNYFYTTAINRATRNQSLPEALTLREALEIWPNHVNT